MSEEKQIEELAKDIYSLLRSDTMSRALASLLYGEGWRKQNVGEWIESYSYGVWHYDCPFCQDGYAVEEREKSPEHFCNNCGARLDGARMKEEDK